jgi:hypothetical protein
MKWSIGSKIGSGFGLALVALMIVGAVSYNSTAKLIDSAEWVGHTHEVLNALDDLLSGIKDAETGQRGYVITGEARYLEPYQGAREVVDQRLKSLRELTPDNPIQQQRLSIRAGVEFKTEEFPKTGIPSTQRLARRRLLSLYPLALRTQTGFSLVEVPHAYSLNGTAATARTAGNGPGAAFSFSIPRAPGGPRADSIPSIRTSTRTDAM